MHLKVFDVNRNITVLTKTENISQNVRKRTFGHVRPAKIQISRCMRALWSDSSLGAFWTAKDAKSRHADNEDWSWAHANADLSLLWALMSGGTLFALHILDNLLSYLRYRMNCNRLSLSQLRLSRITTYLEAKIWKFGNQTTGNKILWKRGEIAFLLFSTLFSIYLWLQKSNYKFICEMWLFDVFSLILQIWYVDVRISRSISKSPSDLDITRVDCILCFVLF